jgi:ATP-dependent DNA helicase RecG
LRFADLVTDEDLVLMARDAAESMLDAHPDMARAHLDRWLGGRADFMKS